MENMKKYVSKKRPVIISLGKYEGILEYKKIIVTGIIPAFLKWLVELRLNQED